MRNANMLSIEGNVLKDRQGRVVAAISPDLESGAIYAYAHVFAISSELLEFMKGKISPIIGRYIEQGDFGKDKYAREGGHQPYTQISVNGSFSEWIKGGIQAIALAEGEAQHRKHYRMQLNTNLRQLFIEGNILKDDMKQLVATLSKDLSDDERNAYAGTFAASVEVLDIIDTESSKDLARIKSEYDAALEFNKHNNLPANVTVLGAIEPFVPREVEQVRRLVAKAQGKEYKDWA